MYFIMHGKKLSVRFYLQANASVRVYSLSGLGYAVQNGVRIADLPSAMR